MIRRNRTPKKANINLRFNILTVVIYIIGIILIVKLFSLQIVHGAEYREQSNTRLTRESVLEAARGDILDRTGATLVTSDTQFALEMYKTKIDDNELNISILNLINVLEKYGVSYPDSFPISINPYNFTIEGEELAKWKEDNDFDENIGAEEAFNEFVDKYEITNTTNVDEIRKILAIRYQITIEGYSSTKSITIAENIPREAVAEFSESSDKFAGINISVKPIREYTSGTLAAHILGYASQISSEEYATRKDTYSQNDIIGKTGIEYVFEEYLKGKNGTRQIDMAVDGTTTAEYIAQEAVEGSDIVLTIDANLQKVTEDALAANIQKISSGGFGQRFDTNAGACVVMNVNSGEILAMAIIIHVLNKDNNQPLTKSITAVSIAKMPLVISAVLGYLTYISSNITYITSPIASLLSVISTVLMFFVVKESFKEEENEKALKMFIKVEVIYHIVAFAFSFLGIYL